MPISSSFSSFQTYISPAATQPTSSINGSAQFAKAMTATGSIEDLLPGLCLVETEPAVIASANESPVRLLSELLEDELTALAAAISRTKEVAIELETYLLTRTCSSAEAEIISEFGERLLESMQHGKYAAAFALSSEEGKDKQVQFPPKYVENNIEIRPGHKEGIIWLIAQEKESGNLSYVPLSQMEQYLTSVIAGRR